MQSRRSGVGQRAARISVLIALALIVAPAAASAATRYATASSGGDVVGCPAISPCTLVHAVQGDGTLNNPSGGDEVVIEPGTYSVAANISVGPGGLNIHGVVGQPRPVINLSGSGNELEVSTANVSYLDIERTGSGSVELLNDDGGTINGLFMSGDASGGGTLCQCYDGTVIDSVFVNTGTSGGAAGINSNSGSGTEAYYNDTFVATQPGGVAIELNLSNANAMTSAVQAFTGHNVIAYNAAGGHDIAIYSDDVNPTALSTATLTLTNSAYQSPFEDPLNGATATVIDGGGNVSASPVFANAGMGDYHELASSPTVGTGVVDVANDGSSDFDGLARQVAGLTDMGAFAYQLLSTLAAASKPSVTLGTPDTFTATATDPNTGAGPLTYVWHFDDGTSATGAVVSHTFATTGTHTAHVTVSDGTPYPAATAATSVTVTAVPPVQPTLTSLSIKVVQPKPAKGKVKATKFSATLSYSSASRPRSTRRSRGS